ncbi:MAG: DUF1566 domain-containing protein [Candidatus Schekmanbacteria bacterium]|nr:DUF1566 domain-containing protein [Candidatus Schekmanbacteria bacterium]
MFKVKSLLLLCLAAVLLLIPVITESAVTDGTISLQKTGQAKCYDSDGNETNCAGTGQDAALLAGESWPDPRFTDNGDETVTDNLTGLMWAKDGNVMQARDPDFDADGSAGDGSVYWQHALDYVAKLNTENYLGHNDWHLPNVNELQSLINADEYNSAGWLNENGFTNVMPNDYWTSSTSISYKVYAWAVYMGYGYSSTSDKNTTAYYVWPVRSGQMGTISIQQTGNTKCYDSAGTEISCTGTGQDGDVRAGAEFPSPRFTDNGDGTVSDNLTGLMWTKSANSGATTSTWQEALDTVAGMNSASGTDGYTDWRLPNMNELKSLLDFSEDYPSLPQGHPFTGVRQDYYWTSSTLTAVPGSAFVVSMDISHVYYYSKKIEDYYGIWPVRGGEVEAPPEQFPDLTVKTLGSSGKPKKDKKITLSAVVKNIGEKSASTSSVQFYLSTNNNASSVEGDKLLGTTKATGNIKVNGSKTVKLTLKVKGKAGNYYLKAFCDSGAIVTESNESNNIKVSKKISIK